ncbi:MAG: Rha family transcriptional regulator [Methanosarcinaceae archaeon]
MKQSKSKAVVKKQNVQIVFPRGKGGFTSSLIVADRFEVRHKDVLRKIEKLVEKPGGDRLIFTPVEYKDKKGEFRKMYEMGKKNFIILAMRFTSDRALAWQIKFVDLFEFYEDQYNQKKYDTEYIKDRTDGIIVRHVETDAIKILKDYGRAAGAGKGFLNNVYSGYTKMSNKSFFIVPKSVKHKNLKEELNKSQLRIIAVAEEQMSTIILEQIELKTDYHDIYYIVKDKMEQLGLMLGRTPVPLMKIEQTKQTKQTKQLAMF